MLETYVKRLEKLEGIADSFKGVSKSFALQAGREIRIMVESEKISGTITAQEYAQVKTALETVLKRALKHNS